MIDKLPHLGAALVILVGLYLIGRSKCWFGHGQDWTRVLVDDVWMRQCERCQEPMSAILVNAEAQDIQPARVPKIKSLKAKKAKAPKQKPRENVTEFRQSQR